MYNYASVGWIIRLPCGVMSVLCGVAAAGVACTYTCSVHVQLCVQVVRDGQLQVEEEIERQKEVCASLMLSIK